MRSPRVINFSVFSKLHSRSKSTLGCYIVKTTASVALNDTIRKVSGNAKLLYVNQKKIICADRQVFPKWVSYSHSIALDTNEIKQ